jgi:beta-lactamase superfamily II metal-dependent hydrolase
MSSSYHVHSYHLNVGSGDSAIHLLIADGGAGNIFVERAVLVDGGPSLGYPVLDEAIKRITARYNLITHWKGKKQLQFDAIVVTHWDDDHWHGHKHLLQNDLQDQWIEATDPTKGRQSANPFRSKYMKYDQNDKLTPLTYFYAPYWGADESIDAASQTVGHIPEWRRSKAGNAYLDILVGHWKDDDDWVIGVALLCTTTGIGASDKSVGMIGRNFFWNGQNNNDFRAKANITLIQNPGLLITAKTSLGRPGLYCIGADSILVMQGSVLPKKKASVSADAPDVIDAGKETAVNRSSIMCVILSSKGQVLHYFGGDVAYQSEKYLPGWFNFAATDPPPWAMKLGHHGASSSSPVSLIQAMRPNVMIGSSGHLHGHPSKLAFSSLTVNPPPHAGNRRFIESRKHMFAGSFTYGDSGNFCWNQSNLILYGMKFLWIRTSPIFQHLGCGSESVARWVRQVAKQRSS